MKAKDSVAQIGYTLDTGALIALEKRDTRMRNYVQRAHDSDLPVHVPAVVLLEWFRGARGQQAILARLLVEPTTQRIAEAAGRAIAAVHKATAVDAAVMAAAALRGDVVFTSDITDMQRLQTFFPSVTILGV